MSAAQFDALLALTARVVAAARVEPLSDAATALGALGPLQDWRARQHALDALDWHWRAAHHIHALAAQRVRDRADFADLMTIVAAGLAALRPLWQRFDSSWSDGWLAQGREFEKRCESLARLCVEIDLLHATLAALDADVDATRAAEALIAYASSTYRSRDREASLYSPHCFTR